MKKLEQLRIVNAAVVLQILVLVVIAAVNLDWMLTSFAAGSGLLMLVAFVFLRNTARGQYTININPVLDSIAFSVQAVEDTKRYRLKSEFPKRACEGESFLVSASIIISDNPYDNRPEIRGVPDGENAEFFIELEAPSFKTGSSPLLNIGKIEEERESERESESGRANWILQSTSSGIQKVLLRIYASDKHVADHIMQIKVTKVIGLTANQVFIIGTALSMLSGTVGIAGILWKIFMQ